MTAWAGVRPTGGKAALVPILLLAWALGLHQLGADSLWLDEIATATTLEAAESVGLGVALSQWVDVRPLYFAFLRLAVPLSSNEFGLRAPSVAWGLLGVATLYPLGRVLLGRAEAAWAALLLAASPLHLRYMQEARPYALFLWLSLLSLYLFLRAWRSGRWRWWAAFAAVSALNLYTHYFATFVLAAELGVGGVLLGRDYLQPGQEPQRPRLAGLTGSMAAVGLVMLPSLPAVAQFLGREQNNDILAQKLTWSSRFWVDVANQLGIGVKAGAHLAPYTWLLLALCLGGLLALGWRRRWTMLLWLAAWAALPFLVLSLIPSWHLFHIRYVIYVLPILLLAAARGLAALTGGLDRFLRFAPGSRPLASGLLAVGVLALSVAPLQAWYARQKQPWRELAALLNTHAAPGDVVVAEPGWFTNCLRYYGYEFAHDVSGSC